jgi:hypothetical protein
VIGPERAGESPLRRPFLHDLSESEIIRCHFTRATAALFTDPFSQGHTIRQTSHLSVRSRTGFRKEPSGGLMPTTQRRLDRVADEDRHIPGRAIDRNIDLDSVSGRAPSSIRASLGFRQTHGRHQVIGRIRTTRGSGFEGHNPRATDIELSRLLLVGNCASLRFLSCFFRFPHAQVNTTALFLDHP